MLQKPNIWADNFLFSLDRIRTHIIDKLLYKLFSLMSSGLDHSATSSIFKYMSISILKYIVIYFIVWRVNNNGSKSYWIHDCLSGVMDVVLALVVREFEL